MSKVMRLRDGSTHWITDEQAEKIFLAINGSNNVRMIRVVQGNGFVYVSPQAIDYIKPAQGEMYKSDADLRLEQAKAEEKEKERLAKLGAGRTTAGVIDVGSIVKNNRRLKNGRQ